MEKKIKGYFLFHPSIDPIRKHAPDGALRRAIAEPRGEIE